MTKPFFTYSPDAFYFDGQWKDWVIEFARLEAAWRLSDEMAPRVRYERLTERIKHMDALLCQQKPEAEPSVHAMEWQSAAFWEDFLYDVRPSTKKAWDDRARAIHRKLRRQLEGQHTRARDFIFGSLARLKAQCGVILRCIALATSARSVVAQDHNACRLADYEASVHPAFAPPRAVI